MGFLYVVSLCAATWLTADAAAALAPHGPEAQRQVQADPADSLYSRARRALDERNYDAAARLFDSVVTQFPRSIYAPDALYWKGFALYRSGNLEGAAAALEAQAGRYPKAPTRADAAPLLILVKGALAKRGDAAARRSVDSAEAAAAATSASGAAGAAEACTNMEVRVAALDALQQMDAERAMPLLRKVLGRRDECSTTLRKNALFILAQKKGADRERLLLEIAKTDPNRGVRNDGVFYLGQANSAAAVDALEDLLLHGEDNAIRSNALYALAQLRADRARRIIQDFALADGAPMPLRNDALYHAAGQRSPETNSWLASVVANPRAPQELRKNAIYHLAQRDDTSDELAAVYDTSLPAELKKELIYHLAQRKDDQAMTKLIAIAKTDANPALRKEALYHLGQSRNPRALKAIEEIVAP
jgi:HEAT repeat protein